LKHQTLMSGKCAVVHLHKFKYC